MTPSELKLIYFLLTGTIVILTITDICCILDRALNYLKTQHKLPNSSFNTENIIQMYFKMETI